MDCLGDLMHCLAIIADKKKQGLLLRAGLHGEQLVPTSLQACSLAFQPTHVHTEYMNLKKEA